MSSYIAKFKVTGYDHDGYCSGAEGSEIDPYFKYDFFEKIEYIMDDQHHGCTSGGSGYCHGCYQNHIVVGAYEIDTQTKNELLCTKQLDKLKEEYIRDFNKIVEKRKKKEKELKKLVQDYDNYNIDIMDDMILILKLLPNDIVGIIKYYVGKNERVNQKIKTFVAEIEILMYELGSVDRNNTEKRSNIEQKSKENIKKEYENRRRTGHVNVLKKPKPKAASIPANTTSTEEITTVSTRSERRRNRRI